MQLGQQYGLSFLNRLLCLLGHWQVHWGRGSDVDGFAATVTFDCRELTT